MPVQVIRIDQVYLALALNERREGLSYLQSKGIFLLLILQTHPPTLTENFFGAIMQIQNKFIGPRGR